MTRPRSMMVRSFLARSELMCGALVYNLKGTSIWTGAVLSSPEIEEIQTIWKILVSALHAAEDHTLMQASNKQLRLALVATRTGRYQSSQFGGSDLMASLFDDSCHRADA